MTEIIKLRPRGQLTLPKKIRDRMQIGEGDYLEIELDAPRLVMRPARLVTYGTPEAKASDRRAEEEIAAGRYETFDDADELMDSLRWDPSPPEAGQGTGVPEERRPRAGGKTALLADLLVERSGGQPREALSLWEEVGCELAQQAEEAEEDEEALPATTGEA